MNVSTVYLLYRMKKLIKILFLYLSSFYTHFRVHQFTKVEMFICSQENKSKEVMDEIVQIQEKLFGQLGLHFKVIDMPPNDLGSPAYRYKIQALVF